MTNERPSVSATGGEKNVKDERYDLLPKEALDVIARVYAFGAEKYADHNWRKGYDWSKSYAALQRHLTSFWAGETHDRCGEDCEFLSETGDHTCRNHSGLPHLGHAGFHVFALLTWLAEQGEGGQFDDRYMPDVIGAMEREPGIAEPGTEGYASVEEYREAAYNYLAGRGSNYTYDSLVPHDQNHWLDAWRARKPFSDPETLARVAPNA